jgi:hypothetical protein
MTEKLLLRAGNTDLAANRPSAPKVWESPKNNGWTKGS